MAYPQEVKTYAKDLYLTPNAMGGHKHTLQKIADKIKQQFPELGHFPNRSTISQWSKRKSVSGRSWREIWEEGLVRGLKSAEKEVGRVISEEEKIIEELHKFQRLQALISVDLRNRAYNFYKESDYQPKDNSEAERMYRLGMDIEKSMKDELTNLDRLVEVTIRVADESDVEKQQRGY